MRGGGGGCTFERKDNERKQLDKNRRRDETKHRVYSFFVMCAIMTWAINLLCCLCASGRSL